MKCFNGETKICRLCGTSALLPRFILENAPIQVTHFLDKTEIENDKPINLTVFECDECGFIQLNEEFLANNYYDYYNQYVSQSSFTPGVLELFFSHVKQLAERFGWKDKRIIDVGCGQGITVKFLNQLGVKAFGIEPSIEYRKIAGPELIIFSGYVSKEKSIEGCPYDGFITFQVLEHVHQPNSFLQGIRFSLKDGAEGSVIVPCIETSFKNNRFFDFFSDHLNYFTERTLRHALNRNGFTILEVRRLLNEEWLEVLVKLDSRPDFDKLQKSVSILCTHLNNRISQLHKGNKRIAIWGAGAKGVSLLSIAGVKNIAYVVDSDSGKQGKFMPGSHLKVFSPEHILKDPVDVILITALAYRDEILSQLKNDLNFEGEISILGE